MIFGLFCLLTLTHGATARQQASQTTTITILQLNDVYQISPVDGGRRGGMARVATLRKKILSESPHTLFLMAGDFISPSVASRLFKGKQMVDALNSSGLDIATLGNHEFDFGADTLRERMRESRFTYTIANVFDKGTGQPFGGARQYIIREMGGVRVAIFGLLLRETATMSAPGQGVRFEDPIRTGARLSRKLRKLGADVIIALTHLPMREDKRLATEADIDIIVGGHEHELLEAQTANTLILKMGSDARNLGRIDINLVRGKTLRGRRGRLFRGRFKIQSIDFVPIPVTNSIKDDAEVAAVVAGYENQLNASLAEVIGKTSVALEARASVVRFSESNLGNFLADVYRQALASDVALVNGGSIRSDATYGPGELTKRDVLTILPFENTLVKVGVTGAHLKRLLENGVSAAGEEDGRFPHVSGMSFVYDAKRAVGARVTKVEVAGQPLLPEKTYTMVVSAYVLGGGDGYDFKGAQTLVTPEEGPVEPDVVMEAIRKQGTISPQVEGRIKSAQPAEPHSLLLFNYNYPKRHPPREAAYGVH
jgi:5'-nucleotidase